MYFPRYWVRTSVNGPGRDGSNVNVIAWGWSDISDADALVRAEARARAALPRIPPTPGQARQAAYYEDRPFREPVLQDHSQGTLKVLITRNSFGCEVLNTDRAGFADIDFNPPRVGIFASLFGHAQKKKADAQTAWESVTLEKLRIWQRENPAWSFRVYRTAGGFRLLATSHLLTADSPQSLACLDAVGSDPLYRKLCQNQKSFRARLTPKPWRCGLHQLRVRFPWAEEFEKRALEKWLQKYQIICGSYAVCVLVETIGTGAIAPELKPLVVLHDQRTAVGSNLPLA